MRPIYNEKEKEYYEKLDAYCDSHNLQHYAEIPEYEKELQDMLKN